MARRVRLRNTETGKITTVYSVDARELLKPPPDPITGERAKCIHELVDAASARVLSQPPPPTPTPEQLAVEQARLAGDVASTQTDAGPEVEGRSTRGGSRKE